MAVPVRLQLAETTENVAPSTAGCSWTDGRAVSVYQIIAPSVDDLAPTIVDILGTTSLDVQGGKLNRKLPMAHPAFPFWYASAINDIQGTGKYVKVRIPNVAGLEAPPISADYALYPIYNVKVQFTPRPYHLLKDSRIRVLQSDWFPDNDTGAGPGLKYWYAEEWLRYVDISIEPVEDSITATHGEMIFRDPDVFGFRYSGMPRLYLKNQRVVLKWDQIPYRYVTSANSYIKKYRGRVNQEKFMNWNPGELLYLGFKIARRYTPPVPRLVAIEDVGGALGDPFAGGGVFSTEKFVDLELNFLETTRKASGVTYNPAAFNRNWVNAGMNLEALSADRKFHYATSYKRGGFAGADAANQNFWTPSWLSVPHQVLFFDPDFPNPNI